MIVWVDCETTGLYPEQNGIVEIGAVLVEEGVLNKKFSALVNPGDVEISPYAMEVNGLSLEYLQSEGEHIGEVLRRFDRMLPGKAIIAGWNTSGFDIPFLKRAYKDHGVKWRFHHHNLDYMVLANVLKQWGLLPGASSLSLQNIATYLGVGVEGESHRALPDVYLTMAVADELKNRLLGGASYGV